MRERALNADLIARLKALRTRYEPAATARKTALLARAAARHPARPAVLLAYHELLLFLVAYPDDA